MFRTQVGGKNPKKGRKCMTEKSAPSKNEKQRHTEAEKMKAEVERSLAVAKAKLAHIAIEEIEKQRKRSSIYSLTERVIVHFQTLLYVVRLESPFITEKIKRAREEMKTYESIRSDFKEIMGLSDEKLERLFPKINSYFETEIQAMTVLINMVTQERQMLAYSHRMTL